MTSDDAYVELLVLRNKFWNTAEIPHYCRRAFWYFGSACYQGQMAAELNKLFNEWLKLQGGEAIKLSGLAILKTSPDWILEQKAMEKSI